MSRLARRRRAAPARARRAIAALAALGLLGACTSLTPAYERPASPVPAQFPAAGAVASDAAMPEWSALVRDPAVRALIDIALANNRDLRVAALNVERARAALAVSDANRLPTIGAGLSAQRAPNTAGKEVNTFQAGLTASAWELDLFGRIASGSRAAGATLLANEYAQRATRLSLVTQVVSTALALQSDEQQFALSRAQAGARAESLRLTTLRANAGAASDLDLATARTLAAQGEVALAQADRQRGQSRTALALLLGAPVPEGFPAPLTGPLDAAPPDPLAPVPVRLSSEALLRRPDIMQAEQALIAANENIGAARAAYFPKLTLTGSLGEASDTLSGIGSGSLAWTALLQATVTLFDAGRNEATVRSTVASRDIAVAQYEKAIQSAFKDVADALSGLATWRAQRSAAQAQRDAEADRNRLTHLRYDHGAASLLELLDAERAFAAAEQALLQTRLAEAQNRLALYRALGGAEGGAAGTTP